MIASGLKLYQCQNLLKINLLVINYEKKNSTHQLLFIILKSLNKKDNHSLKIPILI